MELKLNSDLHLSVFWKHFSSYRKLLGELRLDTYTSSKMQKIAPLYSINIVKRKTINKNTSSTFLWLCISYELWRKKSNSFDVLHLVSKFGKDPGLMSRYRLRVLIRKYLMEPIGIGYSNIQDSIISNRVVMPLLIVKLKITL